MMEVRFARYLQRLASEESAGGSHENEEPVILRCVGQAAERTRSEGSRRAFPLDAMKHFGPAAIMLAALALSCDTSEPTSDRACSGGRVCMFSPYSSRR